MTAMHPFNKGGTSGVLGGPCLGTIPRYQKLSDLRPTITFTACPVSRQELWVAGVGEKGTRQGCTKPLAVPFEPCLPDLAGHWACAPRGIFTRLRSELTWLARNEYVFRKLSIPIRQAGLDLDSAYNGGESRKTKWIALNSQKNLAGRNHH